MLHARSSLRRSGPYGCIGTSQTMAYLCSCSYPPVLSSRASAVSKYLNKASCPSSDTFSFSHQRCASFSLFFLSFFAYSHRTGLAFFFLSGQRKWQQWLRKRRDSWTVMDSRSCCICTLITPSLYCLCPHFFLSVPPHPSLSFDIFTSFHFLSRSWFLLSLFTSTSLSKFSLPLIRFLIPHIPLPLSLSASLFFSCSCPSVPARLCGRSPCSGLSVSWLTEGSQILQYKHETISKWLAGWLWSVEASLHISLSQARSTGLPIKHISW